MRTTDAYKNIKDICSPLGKKVLIVGGETALSKAEAKLKANMQDFEMQLQDAEYKFKETKRCDNETVR